MNLPIVHVVDDDPMVSRAIARLLRSFNYAVETYDSPRNFLNRKPLPGPGCLILDLSMPDMNGLELQELLGPVSLGLAVIFVTGQASIASTVRAMKAGAVDFLTKPFEDTQLLNAVSAAIVRSKVMFEEFVQAENYWKLFSDLTPRERQVCLLVARGLLNKQVGGELGIQEKTIKLHRSNIMRKLNMPSLADMVRLLEVLKRAGRLEAAPSSDLAGKAFRAHS